ncbi:YcjX family protein [Aliiruegeria sabulilitoris]|uniref:YcjX family protein n=1 Tax=Aliiruegeria sabulilitoris TaxID=1510458 RepID=UPI00082ADD05|nr:YcjX family protein [Aliiruegeria sabulilitoris]NDR55099.1 YcjX family protein [Pseudoruegeria sp. M32A2M]
MVIGRIADGIVQGVEDASAALSESLFEPVIRIGVTGFARAGKTVFITSLVANLMDRGRMPGLVSAADGAIVGAWLQPQPDDTVPRFAFESHLAALTGPAPHWPQPTSAVSELRLSLKVQPRGFMGSFSGPRTIHLDIIDYPGEWLLDLQLLERSYDDWSSEILQRAADRPSAAGFLQALESVDGDAEVTEPAAQALAAAYIGYLGAAREAGFSDCTPGRFLMPGEMAGSPALTFAPMPPQEARAPRGSLRREMERRYESYKAKVVKPFFRDHFARIDRQIVLVDLLGAIHAGPKAVEDLGRSMNDILGAFRPGRNAWLTRLLGAKRVERILFAATKADHIHHTQHGQVTAIMEAMLRQARDRADFAGARTNAMAIAALRATVEETRTVEGRELGMVRGRLESGKEAVLYPGTLPEDPSRLLVPAREGAERWLDGDYSVMRFAPAPGTLKPGEGPPHIRLDRAAEFLFGDRLK